MHLFYILHHIYCSIQQNTETTVFPPHVMCLALVFLSCLLGSNSGRYVSEHGTMVQAQGNEQVHHGPVTVSRVRPSLVAHLSCYGIYESLGKTAAGSSLNKTCWMLSLLYPLSPVIILSVFTGWNAPMGWCLCVAFWNGYRVHALRCWIRICTFPINRWAVEVISGYRPTLHWLAISSAVYI